MTREEARSALAATWQFRSVRGLVVVREVALIDALRDRETPAPPELPVPAHLELPYTSSS